MPAVLMVTATDRLARNTRDLLNILHAVKEAGAGFRSIAEPMVDTTSQFAEILSGHLRGHLRRTLLNRAFVARERH